MTAGIYIARDAKKTLATKEYLTFLAVSVHDDPPEMWDGHWHWPGERVPIIIGHATGPVVGCTRKKIELLAAFLQPGELVFVPLGKPKSLGIFKKNARLKQPQPAAG
jgi:hypothetical protein